MLEKFVSGLPSNHFSIDRKTGEISRRGTAEAGERKEQAVAGAA
jgi:hypothetical protein